MSCPRNTRTKPCEFIEDGIGSRGPCEGATASVVVLDEVVDSSDQILDTSEAAATDGLLGDETKPSLDLIEPG